MDQQELQKTIAKYYVKLPPKVAEYFSSMAWLDIIKSIKEKNNFTEEQLQTLSIETTLLLLAIISKEEYEEILEKELGLEKAKLETILKEIDAFILNNINLELRATFEKNQDESIVGGEIEENTELIKEVIIPKAEEIKEEKIIADPKESKVEKIVGELKHEEKVYQIGRENNLTIAQITMLAEIVGNVLNGKIFGDQFLNALDVLKLDIDKKKKIAESINDQVFKEIRNRMMGKTVESQKVESYKEINPQEESEGISYKDESYKVKSEDTEKIEVIKKDPEQIQLEKVIEEDKKIASSIINQKLQNTVKSNITNSNHSLTNINPADKPKIDPYREIPE